MSLKEDIEKAYAKFGKKLSIHLKANLETAIHKAGSKNVQEADLNFEEVISTSGDGVKVQILATEKYWYWVEHGRRPGKQPPAKALGKQWQTDQKINAKKVIAEIQLRYKRKHGIKEAKNKLKRPKKELSYDKAAIQLSFIIARSIGKKGYKARPFIDKALKEVDMEGFLKGLSQLIGKSIIGELTIGSK